MSVSLVPLIYLNRSDLYVARSANVARVPTTTRTMLARQSIRFIALSPTDRRPRLSGEKA